MRKLALALALVTGTTALAVVPVTASVGIGVTPAVLRLESAAGGGGDVTITVTNNGDSVVEFAPSTQGYADMTGDRSAVDWISLSPDTLRLDAGRSGEVSVSIAVPDDAVSGGRYALIMLPALTPTASGTAMSLGGSVGVPVLLTVRGTDELTRTPVVDRFAAVLEADGRLGFRADISDAGNTHAAMQGQIEIRDVEGTVVATTRMQSRTVLPGRSLVLESDDSLPLWPADELAATLRLSPSDAGEPDDFAAIETTVTFDLTSELAVSNVAICENLDRAPTVSTDILNTGTLGLLPAVTFEVQAASVTTDTLAMPEPALAWPGETVKVAGDLHQRLDAGDYTLVMTATYGADAPLRYELPFSIGGDPATAAPLCETHG